MTGSPKLDRLGVAIPSILQDQGNVTGSQASIQDALM